MKNILIGTACVVAVFAICGAYFYPIQVHQVAFGSPAGSTFNTSKVAQQVITTTSSTTFSILNGDASARTITGADVFLANGNSTTTTYRLICATSSVSQSVNNSNNVLNATIVANGTAIWGTTTAAGFYFSSSSPGIMGTSTQQGVAGLLTVNPWARIWPSGSYLNCAVTTAVGSNSNLFDANVTGYIAFPYRGN